MKQHLKKLCGTFLALSMLLTLLPVTAFAADATIDLSTLGTTPSGSGWSYDSGTQMLAIGDSGSYNITGTSSGSGLGISAPNNGFQITGASFAVSPAGIQAGQSVQIKENSSVTGGGGIYAINSAADVLINGSAVALSGSIYAVRAATNVLINASTVNLSSDSGPAVSAGGVVTISGGTVNLSGGTYAVQAGEIVITGGSVDLSGTSGAFSARPKNGGNSPVYLVTLTGLPANKTVSVSTSPAGYNLTGAVSDSSGHLYLWLPTGVTPISFTLDGTNYSGNPTVAANDLNTLRLTGDSSGDLSRYFTDDNFRAAVLELLNKEDGDGIFASELSVVTSLDVSNRSIASLNGIQYFTGLTSLRCDNNRLTSLDVSGLSGLTALFCNNNRLTSLNISGLSGLITLNCAINELTSLNVSGLTAIKYLYCRSNRLTSLDVSSLSGLITLECSYNKLTLLDVSGQSALINLYCNDNRLTSFDISGLPAFRNLSCSNNMLGGALDVSGSPGLSTLLCWNNRLTGLVLPSRTLETIDCSYNWMTGISSVSGTINEEQYGTQHPGICAVLEITVELPSSHVAGIPLALSVTVFPADATSNEVVFEVDIPNFVKASIENGVLTAVRPGTLSLWAFIEGGNYNGTNFSWQGSMEITDTDITSAFTDPNLLSMIRYTLGYSSEIPVHQYEVSRITELNIANRHITSLDGLQYLTSLKTLNCKNNDLTSLSCSNLPSTLETLDCSSNELTGLDLSGLPNLTSLDCSYNNLTSLHSSNLPSTLTSLRCSANRLTSLTLSGLSHLAYLDCSANELTSLDVSGLSSLTTLYCSTNELTSLDVSGLSGLTYLNCSSNELTSLTLSGLSSLATLSCGFNQLTELDLSGLASLAAFSCDFNELTELDLSGLSSLTTLSSNNNNLTSLDLSNLSGLTTLFCNSNELTSLDVSGLSNLTMLSCDSNGLTELDLSGVPGLTSLNCSSNELTSLDVSDLSGLTMLYCCSNRLTGLDVSGLSDLTELLCNDNELISLTLSGLFSLTYLDCSSNELTSLSLSGLSGLTTLYCYSNRLTGLDVSGLSSLTTLYCYYNQMSSVASVVGYDSSLTTFFSFDPQGQAPGPTGYTVIVVNSYAVVSGAGGYSTGAPVSIDAGSRSGYTFAGWTSSGGVSFTNAGNAATTFTMPAQNVTVTANWNSNGEDSSSGGGASSTPAPTTSGSTATTTVTPIVKNGAATASVPASQVTSALEQAQKAAKASGEMPKVEIKLQSTSGVSSVAATIPQESVKSLVSGNVGGLTVSSSLASVTFDAAALTTISGASSGDVTVSAARVDASALPAAVQALVGSRPVYEFTVTGGGKTISQLGGVATVSVPYTLGAGEDPNAVIVSYLNASGNLETVLSGRYNAATGTVTFTTTHFSKYSVGYNKVTFADVSDSAWYADAVTYLAARGVTGGTTDTTFTPGATLTRGQFITLLLKAYGIEAVNGTEDNFADAGSTYYTGYLAAAKQLGITSGVGNNNFAPTQTISRQQMFTLLYNALNALAKLPEDDSDKALSDFTDSGSVAPYAQKAMAYLVEAGVVGGKNGYLLPQSSSTRAQMAQVLYNLLRR
ncbi:leucine-rich repeat domain-containing protein [Oscillibacter sp. GMB15532]|uniref:leucine-rich repeat domain-containing protein n=1 Tax=Oscillibacter sp. GMB15532 TaxID=3230022 RepID=UPI0034DFDCF0